MSLPANNMFSENYHPDFQLLRRCSLRALRTEALFFRHQCGMQILSLENQDCENLFALAFPTPPPDNTGVAHIIEHAVLCGSKKFPLRDPFIEMAKSSQATFINAMTYKNRTVYPIASCQKKDYFNLAAVYWDSVFHPLLTRQSFQQEGWHYEIQGRKQELIYNGIVYNEMSGCYQSLDGILDTMIYRYLFPNTTALACDASRAPQEVCKLTYEQFLKFYQQHYRPERARVLCLGNIPTSEKLSFLKHNLDLLPEQTTPAKPLRRHRRPRTWNTPRTHNIALLPAPESDGEQRGAMALAWAVGNEHNLKFHLQMELLELVLFGNHGAPLQKAVLESGLCSSIAAAGFLDECPQTVFLLALRGCKPENMDQLEKLLLDHLQQLGQQELPQELIQGAYRQMLLGYREINKELCLEIMESVFTAWFADADPVAFIYPEKELAEMEQSLATNRDFVPELIRKHLLQNPHRLRLNFLPDQNLPERQERRQKKELSEYRKALSAQQLAELKQENKLREYCQKQPDLPQAIAALPRLDPEDLPPEPEKMPVTESILPCGLTLSRGELFTNGVGYLSLAFNLAEMPAPLRPILPVFTALFPRLGCQNLPYHRLGTKMAETSAELNLELLASSNPDDEKKACTLNLFLYGLEEYFPDALTLLQKQLTEKTFQEKQRIQELLKLFWSKIMAELQSGGQQLISSRAAAGLSWKTSLEDQWNGWQAARKWQESQKNFSHFQKTALPLLAELADWLGKQTPREAAFCGGDHAWKSSRDFLNQSGNYRPQNDFQPEKESQPKIYGRRELLPLPGEVFSCVQAFRAPLANDRHRAGLTIYTHLLSCGYLWNEIRMKSGAYGVQAQYLPQNATLQLRTIDDPAPGQSLKIFAALPQNKVEKFWSEDEIRSGIIACSKRYLLPWRPGELCQNALLQRLTATDENWRRDCYRALLAQNKHSIQEAAEAFWQNFASQNNCCVLGPARKIRNLNLEKIKI